MKRYLTDERTYLSRCIELAEKGRGRVSPNPRVGCVLVRDGRIVSEGYHRFFGGQHAEIAAIRKAGARARGSTLYVNLEPCSHHGKTPPCTGAIVKAGIGRVVASTKDPNPLVSGRGIRTLRHAGIDVKVGVLRREARRLNEEFFHFHSTGIPFVSLKFAQTLDGKIADSHGRSKWITSEQARVETHRIRSFHDAVLVGARTVMRDNPELTVRHVNGRNPLRVVLDGRFDAPHTAKMFRDPATPTLLITRRSVMDRRISDVVRLERRGIQVLGIDVKGDIPLRIVLRLLAGMDVSSVLVEGGSATLSGFLRERIGDRLYSFVSTSLLGDGLSSINLNNGRPLAKRIRLVDPRIRPIGPDVLIEGGIQFP